MSLGLSRSDSVLAAEARGLSDRRIHGEYVKRSALIPLTAGYALSLGAVISGGYYVEWLFSIPGTGFVLIEALGDLDYPTALAMFFVIALLVLVANFIVDIIVATLDPRIRLE